MSNRWIRSGLLATAALVLALPAFSQEQQQRRGRGAVTGRITAVSETGFDLETRGRMGATNTFKVTLDGAAKFQETKRGALTDLKANHLVIVGGEAGEGGKITARRIVMGGAVDGRPSPQDLAIIRGVGVGRGGPRPAAGQPAPAGARPGPVVGKIVKTSPLTIERIARGDAAPVSVEVATTAETTVAYLSPLTLKDLKVGDTVSVVAAGPRQEGQTEIKATAVTRMPARQPRPNANPNN